MPCSTLGQLVPRSVEAVLKVLLGLLQPAEIKDLMELGHHTPDVCRRKPAVLHSIDDIAPAGVVALRLGKQGRQFGIILHVGFLLDKSFGSVTLISLARHKRAIFSMTFPRGWRPGGQAANLSGCGSWPWGGLSYLWRWCCCSFSPIGAPENSKALWGEEELRND